MTDEEAWVEFMAGGLRGDRWPPLAAKDADLALSEYRKRFPRMPDVPQRMNEILKGKG